MRKIEFYIVLIERSTKGDKLNVRMIVGLLINYLVR
jgi:hypothetical protein